MSVSFFRCDRSHIPASSIALDLCHDGLVFRPDLLSTIGVVDLAALDDEGAAEIILFVDVAAFDP
jgi:hypothetical protein